MSRIWIDPNFRPGMNLLDALTAQKLNEIARAINSARPLGSDTILASPTGAGTVLSMRSGPNAPHPFAIRVTKDGAPEDDPQWLLYVCPGTVYFTSSNYKRRFGFKIVDAESEAATQEVPIDSEDTWELYVKMNFKDDGKPQQQAFEEHLAGVGGTDCVRVLEEVSFYWHKVPPQDKDNDEKEGLTKKDKSDVRYYYIGRVKFSGDTYTIDQRRRSDIDICDPCEDPGSSSSSSSSSGDGRDPGGIYVVTGINCSMVPTSEGGCCVTLTMTKRFMSVTPQSEYTEEKECCGGD